MPRRKARKRQAQGWLGEEMFLHGESWIKRAVDVAGAATGLIVLAPALAIAAILITLDSPGPVLYTGLRAGKRGRPFRCYKLRTMIVNADEQKAGLRRRNERSGPIFKLACDPRITRVGVWLRRYSVDEIPQLWNVLRGEMSLVGPRPHPLDDHAEYEPHHLRRLEVTPGVTGLWQVTARKDPSFERGLALDLEYIQHHSLSGDVRILVKTVGAVLGGGGS